MQRKILRSKNKITLISAILIAIAFISKWTMGNMLIFEGALIIASILGAGPIFIQAYQALMVKVVSIDLLVTIAVTGAFFLRNFEESAIVTFLFLFGAYLEMRTLNKTMSAIKALTEMAPESALKLMEDGDFVEVDVDDVDVGDILLVKTGAKIPVDGEVISGEGSINEASITGESIPVAKDQGSNVFAGTILDNGTIQIVANRVGEDTTFGRIIELVEEAQDSKSEAERFIDSFAKYYTPAVLVLAFIVWLISRNIELAITVLVLGCPGALVIGVPVSNVAGIGNGASHGVLLKGSEVISDFSNLDSMIFDKTGTLTIGDKVENTEVVKGEGIIANVNGHRLAVGSQALMTRENILISEDMEDDINSFERSGNSLVLTGVDGQLKILMGIRDQIRPGVKEDLTRLKRLGVKNLVMLSGDNQGTVDVISSELGLTEAHGNMLPEDKSAYVKKLIEKGEKVAFVGDGVNDSPSLALANIGIAMGSGTDVAIETSDVVLMNSDFGRLPHALGLVKATARNMKQNIVIAVGVVLFLLYSLFFTDWMNMSIGMLVHEGSILVVILNGMRLLNYKLK